MIPVLPALTEASADRFGGAPAWVLARPRRTPATRAGAGCAEGPPRVALLPRAAAPYFFRAGYRSGGLAPRRAKFSVGQGRTAVQPRRAAAKPTAHVKLAPCT